MDVSLDPVSDIKSGLGNGPASPEPLSLGFPICKMEVVILLLGAIVRTREYTLKAWHRGCAQERPLYLL